MRSTCCCIITKSKAIVASSSSVVAESGTKITDTGLKEVAHLDKLTDLILGDVVKITENVVKELAKCESLTYLELATSQITVAVPIKMPKKCVWHLPRHLHLRN